MTTATWIRDFVRSHPEYKGDSVITPGINFDVSRCFTHGLDCVLINAFTDFTQMVKLLDKIEQGEVQAPGFLPKHYAARRKACTDDMLR